MSTVVWYVVIVVGRVSAGVISVVNSVVAMMAAWATRELEPCDEDEILAAERASDDGWDTDGSTDVRSDG